MRFDLFLQPVWSDCSVQSNSLLHIEDDADPSALTGTKLHYQHLAELVHDKLLLLWLKLRWTPAALCLPQIYIYFPTLHSSALLYKAKKSDSLFYIKPWMKLSLWGNYYRKTYCMKGIDPFNSRELPSPADTQLDGCPFFSSFLIADLRGKGL